jgi:hypothetical protein
MDGGTSTAYGPVGQDGPATSNEPALLAAGYIVRQLAAGGGMLSVDYGGVSYPDWGVTADAVLALDAAGAGGAQAASTTRLLADNVTDYVGGGDPSEVYAGPVAKLLNVALAQGVDPTAFGGHDLVATLESLEQPDGRFTDVSAYGDYSNLFGQSLAVIGLRRAGSGPSAAAVDFLADQQCADGGFRLDPDEACSSDPDATAMAVQALVLVRGADDPAVVAGLDYLAGIQQADGGVGGAGPQSGVNANSTALAGQAFLAGARTAQADAAVGFLSALQYGCAFARDLRGAIGYDKTAYDDQQAPGATPSDQDRRSTTQAALNLARTPLSDVTAIGATSDAPATSCPSTSKQTSGHTSSTAGTTTTAGRGGGSAPTTAATATPAVAAGELAYTGADVAGPVTLAVLLLAGGATLLVLSRRRGSHT